MFFLLYLMKFLNQNVNSNRKKKVLGDKRHNVVRSVALERAVGLFVSRRQSH